MLVSNLFVVQFVVELPQHVELRDSSVLGVRSGWQSSAKGASARSGDTSANGQQQRQSDGDPSQPTRALTEAPHTVPANKDGTQQAEDDAEHNAKLIGLPPVTAADKKKTRWDHIYDWGPWVCNLFLVLVGFFQLMLLRQTGEEMHRQAKDAKEQQRAKLAILFPPPNPGFPQTTGSPDDSVPISGLHVRVANYGYTEAFKVVAKGRITATQEPKQNLATENRLNVRSVIRRMTSPETVDTTDAVTIAFAAEGFSPAFKRKDVDAILSKVSHLRMLGVIEYVDAYNDTHETPFDFVWVIAEVVENGQRIDKYQWLNQSKKTI